MPSPFPGMDPYLEHPGVWPGLHNRVIAALDVRLAPILRPHYYVALEERTYLAEPEELLFVGRPDLSIHKAAVSAGADSPGSEEERQAIAVEVPVPDRVRETYLEVRTVGAGEVVAVLELLSYSNKRSGTGRRRYERKRISILGTRTSLVEIDLLRAGDPMSVYGTDRRDDYRILISRGNRRPRGDLYLFSLRDPIPCFRLPLRPGDDEPEVDLGKVLIDVYDRASYDLLIDYKAEPVPPLPEPDREWAETILREAGRR